MANKANPPGADTRLAQNVIIVDPSTWNQLQLDAPSSISGGGTLPVSIYGRSSSPGDTSILTDGNGNLKVYLATQITGTLDTIQIAGVNSTQGDTWIRSTASGYLAVDLAGPLRTPTFANIQTAANTMLAIIAAPPANTRVKIYSYEIIFNQAGTMSFQSPSGTYISGSMAFGANGGISRNTQIGSPFMVGATAATVYILLSASVNVAGDVAYYVE